MTNSIDNKNNVYYGPLMMVFANICFSTSGLLCKFIPWSALATNGVRVLLGSMVLGVYVLVTHHKLRFNLSVLLGAVCMGGVTTLFVAAMKLTSAANTVVLQFTAPIWIIIFSAIFLKQKPKKADLITLVFVFAGVICFFIDGLSAGHILGNFVALAAGICYAVLFMLNSFPGGDRLSSLFLGQLGAGLLLSPLVMKETVFTPSCLISILFLGVVQVGLGYVFFNMGNNRTSAVTACLIGAIEPVLNPLLVALFLREFISPLCMIGAVIVVVSIIIYNLYTARAETTV